MFLERKPAKLAPIAEMDVKQILVCCRLPEWFSWSKVPVLEILKNKLSKKKYGLPTHFITKFWSNSQTLFFTSMFKLFRYSVQMPTPFLMYKVL